MTSKESSRNPFVNQVFVVRRHQEVEDMIIETFASQSLRKSGLCRLVPVPRENVRSEKSQSLRKSGLCRLAEPDGWDATEPQSQSLRKSGETFAQLGKFFIRGSTISRRKSSYSKLSLCYYLTFS